tara:strand:+ start:8826 stop:9578 length:753 start_codon:yes stop_codon:yes gene_type:complete
MSNHFKIVVPFYNVEKWIKKTLLSVKYQSHKDFQCILIDDLSTDSSVEIIKKIIDGDDRFLLIENTEKSYPFENIRNALTRTAPDKENVVIVLHGDDWLATKDSLKILNEEYVTHSCWMTYGSYIEYPSGVVGKFAKKVPAHVIENNCIREVQWMTSHLQSFKYGLWANLSDECFVETSDQEHHFMYAWDLAWTYPLFELAGHKSHFIDKILYVYNRDNPLNVDKVDHAAQLQTEQRIRSMKRCVPLETL